MRMSIWWSSGHRVCSAICPLKEALAILVWGLGYALYLPDVSSGYTWKGKTCMLGFSKCLCHTCVLSSFQKWRLCLPMLLHWPSFRCMQCHQLLLETQSLYRTLGFGQHFELPVSQTRQSKHYPTIASWVAVFKIQIACPWPCCKACSFNFISLVLDGSEEICLSQETIATRYSKQ